ncbi:unnamed protein product [Diamesa serratosioi]
MLNIVQLPNSNITEDMDELTLITNTDKLRANNLLIKKEIAKLERQKKFYLELFMDKIKLDFDKITPEQREFLDSFALDEDLV